MADSTLKCNRPDDTVDFANVELQFSQAWLLMGWQVAVFDGMAFGNNLLYQAHRPTVPPENP